MKENNSPTTAILGSFPRLPILANNSQRAFWQKELSSNNRPQPVQRLHKKYSVEARGGATAPLLHKDIRIQIRRFIMIPIKLSVGLMCCRGRSGIERPTETGLQILEKYFSFRASWENKGYPIFDEDFGNQDPSRGPSSSEEYNFSVKSVSQNNQAREL